MSQPAPSMHKMHKKTAAVEISAGVERLLMQGGEPQPVPHGVVESLVDCADAEGNIERGLYELEYSIQNLIV